MSDQKVAEIQLKVVGLDRVVKMLEDLNYHLQAAQKLVDELGCVGVDVIAID